MEKKSRSSFWTVLLGATAALAVVAVLGFVLLGGDDEKTSGTGKAAVNAKTAANGLPKFALNFPSTWKRVAASAQKGRPPRAVIQRKDGSGIITMTINGPVRQSLDALRNDMAPALRRKFPGIQKLQFRRIRAEAGDGLLSTWVGRNGRVQSNLVVPSGRVSYSLDAVVTPGRNKTANEVGRIYAAFDAEPLR